MSRNIAHSGAPESSSSNIDVDEPAPAHAVGIERRDRVPRIRVVARQVRALRGSPGSGHRRPAAMLFDRGAAAAPSRAHVGHAVENARRREVAGIDCEPARQAERGVPRDERCRRQVLHELADQGRPGVRARPGRAACGSRRLRALTHHRVGPGRTGSVSRATRTRLRSNRAFTLPVARTSRSCPRRPRGEPAHVARGTDYLELTAAEPVARHGPTSTCMVRRSVPRRERREPPVEGRAPRSRSTSLHRPTARRYLRPTGSAGSPAAIRPDCRVALPRPIRPYSESALQAADLQVREEHHLRGVGDEVAVLVPDRRLGRRPPVVRPTSPVVSEEPLRVGRARTCER